jgi:hypothetical protein
MSGDYFTAETEIGRSVCKLETIADMFLMMSGQEGAELDSGSFYGLSLLVKQETDNIKKDTDTLLTHIRNQKA